MKIMFIIEKIILCSLHITVKSAKVFCLFVCLFFVLLLFLVPPSPDVQFHQGRISLTFTMHRKMGILRCVVNRFHKAYDAF